MFSQWIKVLAKKIKIELKFFDSCCIALCTFINMIKRTPYVKTKEKKKMIKATML